MASKFDIKKDDNENEVFDRYEQVNEIESLCMNCKKQGITKLLLTKIPYFRDIVICAFSCPHCFYSNNEVMSTNQIEENGVTYTLHLTKDSPIEYNRQVICSNTATISIPEIQFSIPPNPGRGGRITTYEGILSVASENLSKSAESMKNNPDAVKLEEVAQALKEMVEGKRPCTIIVDDPAGGSFVENPYAPDPDSKLKIKYYHRSKEQDLSLGLQSKPEEESRSLTVDSKQLDTFLNLTDSAAVIDGKCHSCHSDCETRMCITTLPHFKEVIIMVTQCETCGYRDAEIKPGGGISPLGRKIILHATKSSDLTRDLLKSDTSSLSIPELELELDEGTLGGKYTTVEGIIQNVIDQLNVVQPFFAGDSSTEIQKQKFNKFTVKLEELIKGNTPFTLILDCPFGNAWIQSNIENDPAIEIHDYKRTAEQDENLGITDMKTENY